MRVRARGTLLKNRSRSRSRNYEKRPRCIRLLPILCIFIIIMALGIVAVSEVQDIDYVPFKEEVVVQLAKKERKEKANDTNLIIDMSYIESIFYGILWSISLVDRRGIPKVIGGAGTAARIMPGRMRQKPPPVPQPPPAPKKVKPELTFKMEALIRRNALSIELFAQMTLNKFRANYVADIILRESTKMRTYQSPFCSRVSDDCPVSPPNLEGRKDIDQYIHGTPDTIVHPRVRSGGVFVSESCVSRHLLAVVIPYRDRASQLKILLDFLHPFLQNQQLNYRIFVVEQVGNDTFNKGVLMNAGFLTSFDYPIYRGVPYHCVIFHDVDLIPEDDRNMYTCPVQPRHLSVAVDELGYVLPYRVLAGGAFAIRTDHFFKVNGYSNLFWGWGGEDDDMGYRVEHVHSSISRPQESIARYTMLKHIKSQRFEYQGKEKLLKTSSNRLRLDGLNTVQYALLDVNIYPLYTRLLVYVGTPPNSIKVIKGADDVGNS